MKAFSLIAISVCLLPLFGHAVSAKTLVDRVVAVVGDEPILQSDLDRLKGQIKSSAALASIYKVPQNQVSDAAVLKWMLEEKIVHAAVRDMDMPVADSEVDGQIASIAKQNNMTLEQLSGSLKHEGVPFDVYKRNIRAQLERRNVFDKELRRGGGVSEADIRRIYEQKAKPELNLFFIQGDSAKALQKTKADISKANMSLKAIQVQYEVEEFGWTSPDTLDEKVAKAVSSAQTGQGPVSLGGKPLLVFVAGRRVGSEDEFQKAKNALSQEAQAEDYEKRFISWLERKKAEMHIVMNPL